MITCKLLTVLLLYYKYSIINSSTSAYTTDYHYCTVVCCMHVIPMSPQQPSKSLHTLHSSEECCCGCHNI